ncbi:DNA topoisomerase III, partial [Salmonella enterica subsp. enterica serovar Heidelberg]
TNILNREEFFSFNGWGRRFRQLVSEDNWKQAVSKERVILCKKKLIK